MKPHAASLVGLLKEHFGTLKPIRGVEVGVWKGELSEVLLRQFGNLTLWMVDPWEKLPEDAPKTMRADNDAKLEARQVAESRTQYLNRTIVQHTSHDAFKSLKTLDFHFVFIDACHLYESVKEDIMLWWPLVRANCIIAGHDYNGYGDHMKRNPFGVKRAVDEFFGDRVKVLRGNVWWVQKCR